MKKTIILMMSLFTWSVCSAGIKYVKSGGTSTTGASWTDAYGDLQLAINNASAGDSIFVAAGKYIPPPSNSFVMKNGIKVFGGFPAAGGSWQERDFRNHETILSGDRNNDDQPNFVNRSDNATRVLITSSTDSASLIDGFTVRGGNGQGGWLAGGYGRANNLIIEDNFSSTNGGGLNSGGFSDGDYGFYKNIIIRNNMASQGSAIYFGTVGSPTLVNVLITNNQSTNASAGGGGTIVGVGSGYKMINATITGNTAVYAAAFLMVEAWPNSAELLNSIVWGNIATGSDPTFAVPFNTYGNILKVDRTIVEGGAARANAYGSPGWTGGVTYDMDPQFVSASTGDYRLLCNSPAIDTGDISFLPPGVTTDLVGNNRINGEKIDLGAYEYHPYSFTIKDTACHQYTFDTATYTQSGVYMLTYADELGCDSNIYLDLHIFQFETPVISVEGFVLSTATSYTSYQWYKDGVAIPGANEHTLEVTENADYTVEVTDSNGCSGISDVYPVRNVPDNSVDHISGQDGIIEIFPNPASDIINIKSKVSVDVSLSGVDGKILIREKDARSISLRSLAQGIYLMHISDKSGRLIDVRKVIRE